MKTVYIIILGMAFIITFGYLKATLSGYSKKRTLFWLIVSNLFYLVLVIYVLPRPASWHFRPADTMLMPRMGVRFNAHTKVRPVECS